jgi:hypothetical protein
MVAAALVTAVVWSATGTASSGMTLLTAGLAASLASSPAETVAATASSSR